MHKIDQDMFHLVFQEDYKFFKTAILSDMEISGDRCTEKISHVGML